METYAVEIETQLDKWTVSFTDEREACEYAGRIRDSGARAYVETIEDVSDLKTRQIIATAIKAEYLIYLNDTRGMEFPVSGDTLMLCGAKDFA